jgi:hypothetical protein
MSRVVHRWQEVTPPEPANGPLRSMLETVDELRTAWKRSIERASPEEFAEARRRTLRRHAIETGIIERLYDVSWGVTEALVAEGLTLDVAEREGGVSLDSLAVINTQFEALTSLVEAARLAADAASLATAVSTRIAAHVESLGEQLERTFAEIDSDTRHRVYSAAPPDDRARWWFAQLVRAARQVDFYTNLTGGSWWTRLHLTVLGQTMRYVAAVQKVGHGETGVLAVTVFAERLLPRSEPDETDSEPAPIPEQLLTLSSNDSVTLVHTDTAEERWQEIAELIDQTLAAAVDEFSRKLG